MKKEIRYPLIIIFIFSIIFSVIYLSLKKVGPDLNPPRSTIEIDSLQISFISIKLENNNWFFSDEICTPSMKLTDCSKFSWKPFNEYKMPIGKSDLFIFVINDLSKENAGLLLEKLSDIQPKRLFFSSPFDSSLSNTRKVDPSLIFTASLTQIMKWNFFSQLDLSTIYKIDADLIVSDSKISRLLQSGLNKEIQRRNIPLMHTESIARKLFPHEHILVK